MAKVTRPILLLLLLFPLLCGAATVHVASVARITSGHHQRMNMALRSALYLKHAAQAVCVNCDIRLAIAVYIAVDQEVGRDGELCSTQCDCLARQARVIRRD